MYVAKTLVAIFVVTFVAVGMWMPVLARADAIQGGCNFELHGWGKGTWTCKAPDRSGLCYWNVERLSANPNEKTYEERQVGSHVMVIDYRVPALFYFGPISTGSSWLGVKVNYWYANAGESCKNAPDWSGTPGLLQGPKSQPKVVWRPGDPGDPGGVLPPPPPPGQGATMFVEGRFECKFVKDGSYAGSCDIEQLGPTCATAKKVVEDIAARGDVCHQCPGLWIDNTKVRSDRPVEWIQLGACKEEARGKEHLRSRPTGSSRQ